MTVNIVDSGNNRDGADIIITDAETGRRLDDVDSFVVKVSMDKPAEVILKRIAWEPHPTDNVVVQNTDCSVCYYEQTALLGRIHL